MSIYIRCTVSTPHLLSASHPILAPREMMTSPLPFRRPRLMGEFTRALDVRNRNPPSKQERGARTGFFPLSHRHSPSASSYPRTSNKPTLVRSRNASTGGQVATLFYDDEGAAAYLAPSAVRQRRRYTVPSFSQALPSTSGSKFDSPKIPEQTHPYTGCCPAPHKITIPKSRPGDGRYLLLFQSWLCQTGRLAGTERNGSETAKTREDLWRSGDWHRASRHPKTNNSGARTTSKSIYFHQFCRLHWRQSRR
jgi:hypothetical protein